MGHSASPSRSCVVCPRLQTCFRAVMVVTRSMAKSAASTKRLEWSRVESDGVLTLWPATSVRSLMLKISSTFSRRNLRSTSSLSCVETLPDTDRDGRIVPGTGGRIDFFFFVVGGNTMQFAFARLVYGMRWWSDVYFNNQEVRRRSRALRILASLLLSC